MTRLNLPDLAKKIGLDHDQATGKEDWSHTLERALMTGVKEGKPLIPNGTQANPTVVRIPKLYHAVSSIEPYRAGARHIHMICDKGAGFWFSTLGPGDANAEASIARAIKDPTHAIELERRYRTRFLLGGVGGHGWKFQGRLVGPKLAGMQWRSPSGPGSRNCLEAQAAFAARDFGKERTDAERLAGVHGWDLSGCDFGWVWGNAIDPQTDKPNDKPNEGLYIAGSQFHHLGRHGIGIDALSEWHVTWSQFGADIPSSIIHAETGSGPNIIGGGRFDSSTIYSGGYTVHVSGETVQTDGLTVDRVHRYDKPHGFYFDAGPKLPDGNMRIRRITVTNNVHYKWVNGNRLGYYQLCQDVNHTGNSGPISKQLEMSKTLYHHGSVRIRLAPNDYRRP